MNYTELLNRTIEKSGLKNIEIIEKLKDYNISITKSYLSVLRNDNEKKASDELSRAIAEICGAPKSLLVIQAQLDRACDELKTFIDIVLDNIMQSINPLASFLPNEAKAKVLEKTSNLSQADIIADIIEHPDDYKSAQLLMDALNKAANPKYAVIPLSSNGEIRIIDKNGNNVNNIKL